MLPTRGASRVCLCCEAAIPEVWVPSWLFSRKDVERLGFGCAQAVHGLTTNVRKMFLDMDQPLYEECQRRFADEEAKAQGLEEHRELQWKRLQQAADGDTNTGISV